jgi:hypothetical protein
MGREGDTAPTVVYDQDTGVWTDHPCFAAWDSDPDHNGASLYVGGNVSINGDGNDTRFEITGRMAGEYLVSLQAISCDPSPDVCDPGSPSTATVSSGAELARFDKNKTSIAFHGLVWAPKATMYVSDKNKGGPAFMGGLVLARVDLASVPAGLNSLVIRVGSQPKTTEVLISATATNAGSTTVQARILYRTDGYYELLSRRVLGLTPE